MLWLWQDWTLLPQVPWWEDMSACSGNWTHCLWVHPEPHWAKKLACPTETVTPTDIKTWNVVSQACQIKLQNTVVVSAITPYQLARLLTALITLVDSIQTTAMVNSGAMGNFIHPQFVKEHKLVTKDHTPLIVNDVNSWLLSHVDQQVEVWMMVGNHAETLTFDITPLGKHNVVLRLLWLQQHNPTIHWTSGKVTFTSDYCKEHCLAQPASTFLKQCPIVSWVTIENEVLELAVEPLSEQEIDLFVVELLEHLESITEHIPELYHVKINVFNRQKAVNTLPPLCSPNVDFMIKLDKTKPLLKPSHPTTWTRRNMQNVGDSSTRD